MTDICEHGSIRRKCPNCENAILTDELDTIYAVLIELVGAVDEQSDGLDPADRLVRAMKDARSWVGSALAHRIAGRRSGTMTAPTPNHGNPKA